MAEQLIEALSLMRSALALLDTCEVDAGPVAPYLDHAVHLLAEIVEAPQRT